MDSLFQIKNDLDNAKKYLNQLSISEERNVFMIYNTFALLNKAIAELDEKIEIDKLNSESPKKEVKT